MAFRLNKKQETEYNELRGILEARMADVQSAVEAFNTAREAFETFRDERASDFNDQIGEKSDKWQEGDAGQAAQEFAQEWDEEICDEAEVEIELREYPTESNG